MGVTNNQDIRSPNPLASIKPPITSKNGPAGGATIPKKAIEQSAFGRLADGRTLSDTLCDTNGTFDTLSRAVV